MICVVRTNAAGYELTAIMAEANGQGIPLGFLLHVSMDGMALKNAKQHILKEYLTYFRQYCPNIRFTLSDKESSEIEAMRAIFPEAKHTCCYWHAIRYIEGRLTQNRPPATYNAKLAAQFFPNTIRPDWIPKVQAPHDDPDADMDRLSGTVRFRTSEDEHLALKTNEQVSHLLVFYTNYLLESSLA